MLRLLDFIYSKEKAIEGVAAVVLLDLGVGAPASVGLIGKLPAFVLGKCCRSMQSRDSGKKLQGCCTHTLYMMSITMCGERE